MSGAQRPAPPALRTTRSEHLALAAGAVVGVLLRYAVGRLSGQHVPATFPVGTLVINLAGCLLIGVLQSLFLNHLPVRREVQLAVVVGGLGGFTTLSTFAVETVQLIEAGRGGAALLYQGLSVAGGLALALLGHSLSAWAVARVRRRA